MKAPEVTAVIPVYNDRKSLETAIPSSLNVLSGIAVSFELIIAEDGSNDGSAEYVREYSIQEPRLKLLHSDERQGRGRALERAFKEAKGEIVCYYDVDLATDMRYLNDLLGMVREGCAVATGSRLMKESDTTRSGEREIASRGYNFLVRLFLGSTIHDHQCGFKAFSREKILRLMPEVKAYHWFWDTEVLVRSQKRGWKVCELPVQWQQGEGTTVKPRDVISMGTDILRLWWQLNVEKN